MIIKYVKWLSVIVILFSLGVFLYNSDIQAIAHNVTLVGFNFCYLILVTFIAQIFGTLSWRSTLPQNMQVSFKDLFLIRFIGEHIGLINPANFVGGDAFKAYELEKRGVDYKEGISSLVVARTIMIYVQVGVYIVAALIYLYFILNEASLLIKSILISIGFILISLAVFIGSSRFFESRLLKNKGLVKSINSVRSAIKSYYQNQGGRLFMSIFWAVINFLVGAIEMWLICHFIGVNITYLEALVIDQGVLFFKSFAAFIPGQIGVEEYTNKIMLAIVGISSMSVWISVSILRRARQIFWILLGVLTYYFLMPKENLSRNPYTIKS